jgi:Zn-dependent peptidase ImmA (M78 family)
VATIDYISGVVDKLSRKYGTRNPFELCDALGIIVHIEDLGKKLKAYYFAERRIRNIVLNSRVDEILQRVLIAHELGHDCLHRKIAALKSYGITDPFGLINPTEKEANLFAAELLIDDDELLDLLYYDDRTFFGIASELYVPYPLLEFKLRIMEYKGHNVVVPYLANSDFLKGKIAEDFVDFC